MSPEPKNCPICHKPAAPGALPFCSARCRSVDLQRWLTGTYKVASEDSASTQGEEE